MGALKERWILWTQGRRKGAAFERTVTQRWRDGHVTKIFYILYWHKHYWKIAEKIQKNIFFRESPVLNPKYQCSIILLAINLLIKKHDSSLFRDSLFKASDDLYQFIKFEINTLKLNITVFGLKNWFITSTSLIGSTRNKYRIN